MAGQVAAVAQHIAGLTIAGLNHNYGLDAIHKAIIPTECPILQPDPEAFMAGLSFQRVTFRSSSPPSVELRYELHYDLFYKAVLESEQWFEFYGDLIPVAMAVLTAIIGAPNPVSDKGKMDLRPFGTPAFGPVRDFTGAVFHGVKFVFEVFEIA